MKKSCYKSTKIDKSKSREIAGVRKCEIFFRNNFTPFVGLLDRIYNKEHKVEAFKHFVLFFQCPQSRGFQIDDCVFQSSLSFHTVILEYFNIKE